jgi:pyridoxine 5-phosphate synthase
LTLVVFWLRIPAIMPGLSVNIDHVATLRQARLESFPDPVQAATAVELGRADGITVHLRNDRRHITDRDVELLRATVKTELTVEMSAADELVRLMARIRPDQVTLVPELKGEVTTTSGIDLLKERGRLGPVVQRLKKARIRVSTFIEPDIAQVEAAARLGADVVELNTDRYSRNWSRGTRLLDELAAAGGAAEKAGLVVHVGHGLGYQNVVPVLKNRIAGGYSIGFAIVARAVFVGLQRAVEDMKRTMEVYSCERL